MSEMPAIDVRLAREHLRTFHDLAGGFAAAGGMVMLRSGGLEIARPQPLPASEELVAIGGVDPMLDLVVRANRQPGRNLEVPLAIFAGRDGVEPGQAAGPALAMFGFAIELMREPGWISRLPFAPSAALATGNRVWPIFLLDRPAPMDAVRAAAARVYAFAGQPEFDVLRGVPVAGGVYTGPDGRSASVELELPWRPGYSLAQLSEDTAQTWRIELIAETPGGGGEGGGGGGKGGGEGGDDDPPEDDDDRDGLDRRFGGFVLRLHANSRRLEIGSDIEISQRASRELAAELGPVVHAEGELWFYDSHVGCWTAAPEYLLRRSIHAFDGAGYLKPTGKVEVVQLSKGRVDSVMRELAAITSAPEFFKEPSPGVNIANGLITFLGDGTPELTAHDPEHKQRHVIRGKWDRWQAEAAEDPPEGSLLHKLLYGSFLGDPDIGDKINLVGELAGAATTGCMRRLRQKKSFIFKGQGADNGKSQILDLLRAMLPEAAVGAVPPNKFSDERQIIHLRGKLLNARDELTSAQVIASDIYKSVVTGEPVSGRDVYRAAIAFRSNALHVFATNVLPSYSGGFDKGVRRRQGMLVFNRVIPVEQQIVDLGRRIAAEETDLLLAFAVAGASRLLRQQGFTEPPSSAAELREWFTSGDPVAAFLQAKVRERDPRDYLPGTKDRGISSAAVFAEFDRWAKAAGYKSSMQVTGLVPRLRAIAPYIRVRHSNSGNYLCGLTLVAEADEPRFDDSEAEIDG